MIERYMPPLLRLLHRLLLTTMMIMVLQRVPRARSFPPVVGSPYNKLLTRSSTCQARRNCNFAYLAITTPTTMAKTTERWSSTSSSSSSSSSLSSPPPPSSSSQDKRRKATAVKLASPFPTAVLKRSRQSKAFRNGNPLVFPKAIHVILGGGGRDNKPDVGSLVRVVVQDDSNSSTDTVPIGWGVYNPDSLYRIRILCHKALQPKLYQEISAQVQQQQQAQLQDPALVKEEIMRRLIHHHVKVAQQKRRALNLPAPRYTTMYRLINGEGDGLSGLHVDVCGNIVVVQSSAAWCQIYKQIIINVLEDVLQQQDHHVNDSGSYQVIWKVAAARLKQDGFSQPSEESDSEDSSPVIAYENGVNFQLFPRLEGQKTGVYCDQRDNRALVARYTHGKTVLDLCCYHAGFSITALVQGGATSAVAVDSSAAAIQCARANGLLSGIGKDRLTCIQSDVTEYMQEQHDKQTSFDVVVLDPPKLAPTVASLERARRKYHGLNRDAIKLVSPQRGGLLLTCTCSAAMTQDNGGQTFLQMVAGAALAAQRDISLLQVSGAAACHVQSPQAFPTGAYLTAALFYVHPLENCNT